MELNKLKEKVLRLILFFEFSIDDQSVLYLKILLQVKIRIEILYKIIRKDNHLSITKIKDNN